MLPNCSECQSIGVEAYIKVLGVPHFCWCCVGGPPQTAALSHAHAVWLLSGDQLQTDSLICDSLLFAFVLVRLCAVNTCFPEPLCQAAGKQKCSAVEFTEQCQPS